MNLAKFCILFWQFFSNFAEGTLFGRISRIPTVELCFFVKGEGGKVRFRLLQHLRILLVIAGEPQKLDRQKYILLELSFHKLSKNTIFRHLRGIGKILS